MAEFNPEIGATNQNTATPHQASPPVDSEASLPPVDLNRAGLKTLMTLPGIGQKMAERIIRYRETVRPFQAPVEITTVQGISMSMYQGFADRVTVSTPDDSNAKEVSNVADRQDGHLILTKAETEDKAPSDEIEDEGYLLMWGQEPTADKPTKQIAEKIEETRPKVAAGESEEGEESEEAYIIETADDRSSFRRPWILMVVGALLGAFIALALMYIVNGGTINIANHPKVIGLESELAALKQREAAMAETIETLRVELSRYEALNTQLQSNKAEIELLKQSRDSLTGKISLLEAENEFLATRATTLEQQLSSAAQQITALEQDTGRFDGFLSGLRDLLSAENGIAPAVEATPTPAPTAAPLPDQLK